MNLSDDGNLESVSGAIWRKRNTGDAKTGRLVSLVSWLI